jgi:hypothetical protein
MRGMNDGLASSALGLPDLFFEKKRFILILSIKLPSSRLAI